MHFLFIKHEPLHGLEQPTLVRCYDDLIARVVGVKHLLVPPRMLVRVLLFLEQVEASLTLQSVPVIEPHLYRIHLLLLIQYSLLLLYYCLHCLLLRFHHAHETIEVTLQ